MTVPIIHNNPLRILGVFGDASLREIEQNKAQLRAFAHVGQKVHLPLRLDGLSLLPSLPAATEAQLAEAEAMLALQPERERYALFWFERDAEHEGDEEAVRLLDAGRVGKARHLWQGRTDYAARKNLLLLAVLGGSWDEIAACATSLFEDDVASFRIFMTEIVKCSPEANSPYSDELLLLFQNETLRAEMKRVLVSFHKQTLDEAFERLNRTVTTDENLLKEEIERLNERRFHTIALHNLLGADSFTCSQYANETGKTLIKALSWYVDLNCFILDAQWAAKLAHEAFYYLDHNDPDYYELERTKKRIIFRAGMQKPSYSSNGFTDHSKDNSNKGCMWWLANIFFFSIFYGFIYQCSKTSHRRDQYRYIQPQTIRYRTPPVINVTPSKNLPVMPSIPKINIPPASQKDGYIQLNGRYYSIDSLTMEVQKRARKIEEEEEKIVPITEQTEEWLDVPEDETAPATEQTETEPAEVVVEETTDSTTHEYE